MTIPDSPPEKKTPRTYGLGYLIGAGALGAVVGIVLLAVVAFLVPTDDEAETPPTEAETPATTTTTATTRAPTTTRAPAPARPFWCVHSERIDAELALQERLLAQHDDQTADWPAGDLERLVRSVDAQAEAAGRLWDEAPGSHAWADVRRECGVNLPR